MPLTIQTTATGDPVTYAEAKVHLRLDDDDEQTLITDLITVGTKSAESFTGRQFMRATYDLDLPGFPAEIKLRKNPVVSISSIIYIAATGNIATMTATDYQTDLKSEPATIKPRFGGSWPSTRGDTYNAVTVRFVAGYSTTTTSQEDAVPEGLKSAIKFHVAHLFENREPVVVGTIVSKLPMSIENLLWQHKIAEAV